ncbi:hypothetical protein G9F72_024025 [Clostridium estertheticum]|uniref:hypothetical protein n=1 Tax=Clostridium estertheticum TaxID=238834 RepID=UPI0013E91E5B|nr:hypothetical protein [Clostridium estertheticum]MBZ9689369.1 hypothetical protein [Clostridium estertheticum]
MAKNKISVSFSKRNSDLYTLLKNKDNGSNYICNLIRSDMDKYCDDIDFESKIEQTLEKLLKDKQLIYNSSDKLSGNMENKPTSEDVDLILNLF